MNYSSRRSFALWIAVIFFSCTEKKSPSPEKKSGFINIADSRLYYEVTGEGDPVLFLHGGFMDRRMWENQVSEFSKNYKVITCDQRGHGLHNDGDSSYYMYEGLRILLDTLNIKSATVIGLSMGGAVATDFAIQYPAYTKKLVLVTPGLTGINSDQAEDSTLNNGFALLKDAIEKKKDTPLAAEYFIRSWFDGPFRQPSETDTTERRKALNMAINCLLTHKFLHWVRMADTPAIKEIHKITASTLVILGEKDNPIIKRNYETLSKNIPRIRSVVIKGVAHMPNMERPEEFNKIVLDFLREN